jgi:hypothetical protein
MSVNDTSLRPARPLVQDEVLETGRHRFQHTPNVPHCWEAGLLFEGGRAGAACSDLFHQDGNADPTTSGDVVGPAQQVSRGI